MSPGSCAQLQHLHIVADAALPGSSGSSSSVKNRSQAKAKTSPQHQHIQALAAGAGRQQLRKLVMEVRSSAGKLQRYQARGFGIAEVAALLPKGRQAGLVQLEELGERRCGCEHH